MQWKLLLFILYIHMTGFMCVVEGQSMFDLFGSGSRDRKPHAEHSEYYDDGGDEHEYRSLRLPSLDFLNFGSRSRTRERHRDRNRDREYRRNHEDDITSTESTNLRPESRTGSRNPEGQSEQRNNPPTSGPCGENNRLCRGENYIKELGLEWSKRVHNGTGIYLRDSNVAGGKRYVLVGIEQPNEKFGKCKTPDDERGHCRHLEYCVLDEFRTDFITFLQYMCDIPENYVGVCCPEQNIEARTSTTSRPTLRLPGGVELPRPRLPTFPPFFQSPTTTSDPNRRRTTTPRGQPRRGRPNEPSPRTPQDCGINENYVMPRIVGGRVANPKAWPWMAAILKKDEAVDYRAGQYCGGVLIGEFHVLTAGHCVDGYDVNVLAVRIGEYDFARSDDTSSSPQDIDIADIFIHEEYNRYSYQNDIAVIKLASSAFFDKRIRSICLPGYEDADNSLVNEIGIVTGFGTIYYGGPASDKLREISVPIWSQEDCQAAYTQPIEDTHLCAGARAGSKDSCQGDSGGPLQVQLRGRWTTVGVVSWGIRCSEPGYPGVYTRVSKYISWLASRMRQR